MWINDIERHESFHLAMLERRKKEKITKCLGNSMAYNFTNFLHQLRDANKLCFLVNFID